MFDLITYVSLPIVAIATAFFMAICLIFSINLVSRSRDGLLHFYFYGILLKQAVGVAFSNRIVSLDTALAAVESSNPAISWFNRMLSLIMVIVAIERIIHSLNQPAKKFNAAATWLIIIFIIFWLTNALSPAFFGSHTNITHEYLYPLIFGIAALLVSFPGSRRVLDVFRDGTFIFLIVGLILIPIKPGMVMDTSYTQGFIPGLPRLAGLAPHANSLAILTQVFLLCLWVRPFQVVWINRSALTVGVIVIFLAQSKTVWLSFTVSALCILVARQGPKLWRNFGHTRQKEVSISIIMVFITCILGVGIAFLFGDLSGKIDHFFSSTEGAQLTSLTGRDKVWAIAFEEWHRNPIFGYGPTLFDAEFKQLIGMANATHAHNQFVDTLARSGLVGATGLVIYSLVLLVLCLRYCNTSGGLTLALFIALAFRSISEVPLTITSLNFEFMGHVLLLIVLAGEIRRKSAAAVVVSKKISDPMHTKSLQNLQN